MTILFPLINQVTKLAATHRPVVLQRQVLQIQTVLKTVKAPLTQFIDKVVAVHIAIHRQVFLLHKQVTKHIKTPTSIHRELTWLLIVTLLTNRGIPVSSDGIWDVIDEVVPKKATCISWHQQVRVTAILDRHVACRFLHARQYFDIVVDAPVVQSMPEQVRISERTQTVNVTVPQIAVPVPFDKETDEVILPVTAERTSVCTVEQFVDMPVPQIQEQIVEVANTIPQERILRAYAGAYCRIHS